ncbi:mesoderm induction early response protein 3-like [Macrosteles quadrilineatus]|uniref:mesoderm induction early response protein 3-like n=1 Tax=Macrosteles quadrilineatus TaxID=74068 RepID=UPI0023E1D446|nr:mesoderm induction early response protein 3-like [Macrosteles quadrilineatus]XP_054280727.1 mesoderm induction early response protein 3-like [Macrosteles quadrilineatus]
MDPTLPPDEHEADPSFLIMDESDDEETIAQEESLEPEIDPQEELHILASDLNVTLEELTAQSDSTRSRRARKKVNYQALLLKEQMKKLQTLEAEQKESTSNAEQQAGSSRETSSKPPTDSSTEDSEELSVSELTKFYMTNSLSNEDEDADADFKPLLRPKFNREIRVGPSYQAEVPEGPTATNFADEDSEEYDEELLWRPSQELSEQDVEAYLGRINEIVHQAMSQRVKNRDNKKALEILLQCNYNQELALQKFKETLEEYLNGENIENHFNNSKGDSTKEVKRTKELDGNEENNSVVPKMARKENANPSES